MNKLLTAIIAAFALTACQAEEPQMVAQKYWQSLVNNDIETARSMVSSGSIDKFDEHLEQVNTPEALSQVALDGQRTVVVTTINPDLGKPYRDRPFETVMVLEDGRWKIDLDDTRIPPAPTELERQLEDMTNDMNGSVEKNMESLEDMLGEGMKLLDESLEQGSKDMAESFSNAMQKMQEAMRESIEQMKQRREEMQRQQPGPIPDTDAETGEGAI